MEEIRNYLNSVRRDFSSKPLEEKGVEESPFDQFKQWLEESIDSQLLDPYAMVLSTVSEIGYPSSRVVYLRDISDKGMVFYTNYNSSKGKDILSNPAVSLLFHWGELERQVRIRGMASKLNEKQSDEYFKNRPRESQIGAWASEQSNKIQSRSALNEKVTYFEEKFKDFDVPRPDFWGGFIVQPSLFEFWQGRSSRLHDRILYEKQDDKWALSRLSP